MPIYSKEDKLLLNKIQELLVPFPRCKFSLPDGIHLMECPYQEHLRALPHFTLLMECRYLAAASHHITHLPAQHILIQLYRLHSVADKHHYPRSRIGIHQYQNHIKIFRTRKTSRKVTEYNIHRPCQRQLATFLMNPGGSRQPQ